MRVNSIALICVEETEDLAKGYFVDLHRDGGLGSSLNLRCDDGLELLKVELILVSQLFAKLSSHLQSVDTTQARLFRQGDDLVSRVQERLLLELTSHILLLDRSFHRVSNGLLSNLIGHSFSTHSSHRIQPFLLSCQWLVPATSRRHRIQSTLFRRNGRRSFLLLFLVHARHRIQPSLFGGEGRFRAAIAAPLLLGLGLGAGDSK